MKNSRSLMRRVALGVLLIAGAGLIVAGIILERTSVAVAGTGAWLLVAMALLWGMRFRLEQASVGASVLRDDIIRVRRSQILMHSRMSTRLRDQSARLERIRKSQLKLHSRVALQGMTVTKHQREAVSETRNLLESSRLASIDAQRLTLRAYRETHTEWARVADVLEHQGERHQEQQRLVDQVLVHLRSISGEVEKPSRLIGELTEEVRNGWAQQEQAATDARNGFERVLIHVEEEKNRRTRNEKEFQEELQRVAGTVSGFAEIRSGLARQEQAAMDARNEVERVLTNAAEEKKRQVLVEEAFQATMLELVQKVQEMNTGMLEASRRGDTIVEKLQRATEAARGSAKEQLALIEEHAGGAVERLEKGVAAVKKSWTQSEGAIIRSQERSKRDVSQSFEALLQMHSLLPLRAPYPLLDGWAMDPVSMLSLVQLVLTRKPKVVVECGSGTSSVWLAAALREADCGRLISLEHLEDYADRTRKALEAQGLLDIADVRYAPLTQVDMAGETFQWYDSVTFSDLAEVDLLIVDGPPEGTGREARYPAIPLLASKLSADAVVVLDDSDRSDEKRIIERWHGEFAALGPKLVLGPRTTAMEWVEDRQ